MSKEQKPRIFQGGKDMILSVVVVLLLSVLVVLPTGLISPNSPEESQRGPVREVDAAAFLTMEARSMPFPVVIPDTPEGWTTNSARRSAIGAQPASVVGYVTDREGFLQLTQTGVPLEDALIHVDPNPRKQTRTEDIDGFVIGVYTSEDKSVRDIWGVRDGDTTYLVTGVAEPEDFGTLMKAALDAQPVK